MHDSKSAGFGENEIMNSREIQNRLGENLKSIRKSKKLTQAVLAEKAGVSEDTIKSIELSRFWPSEKTLAQISEALEMDVYRFFLPTRGTLGESDAIKNKIREEISKSFFAYVESVEKELEGCGG